MKITGQTAERIYAQDARIQWLEDSNNDDIKSDRWWIITSNYNAGCRRAQLVCKSREGKKVIGATIHIKDNHGDWIVWSFKVFPAILFFGFCASVNYPLEPLEFDDRINSYAFYI